MEKSGLILMEQHYNYGRTINIPNSTTMDSNFGTNSTKIPAPTATGYVYYLWGSKANDSLINDENGNYNN